jgi:hypothetical protein
MKKTFLPILAILFLLTGGFSQGSHAQGLVNFGIKGGLNFANISFDDYDDNSTRTGFTIGAVVDIGIPMFPVGLETGLYYSQQGTTLEVTEIFDGVPVSLDGTIKLDYLKVPVLAKVNFGPPGPFSPHFVAGPYAAFIMNAKEEFSVNGMSDTVDIKDDVESMDFGLTVGLGADLNLMVTSISIQGRYSFGLTDIFDDGGSKNRVLSIVAGFAF